MGSFSLEALTRTVSRFDTWELLGNPTEMLVAERMISECDDDMFDDDATVKGLPLEDVVLALIEADNITTPEALERIAKATQAGEVMSWLDDLHLMYCVTQHTTRRLKARWAFCSLSTWAEKGTTFAALCLEEGLTHAVERYESSFPETPPLVVAYADTIGIDVLQAFRMLTSDGYDARFGDEPGKERGRTKRRMGYRVVNYLRNERARQQPLDS